MPGFNAKRRAWLEWLLLALALPPLMLWLAHKPTLHSLGNIVHDAFLQSVQVEPSGQLVMIAVDRKSLDALGPWPWPHSTHAQLLETLAQYKPLAVVLDLPLDRPDPFSAEVDQLIEAMSHTPVYLVQHDIAGQPQGRTRTLMPGLVAAAAGVGHARLAPANDGVVRTVYAWEGPRDHLLPYVGLLLTGQRLQPPAPQAGVQPGAWQRRGAMGFPLAGGSGTYPTYSYDQVLRGEVPASVFQGRDVLVGIGADAELGGLWAVSAANDSLRLSSLELHANAIDAIRAGATVKSIRGLPRALWIALPVLLGLVIYLRRERWAALACLGLAWLCFLLSAVLLTQHLWVSPIAPVVGLLIGYLVWGWRRQSLMFTHFQRQLASLDMHGRDPAQQGKRRPLALNTAEHYILALDSAVGRLNTLQNLFRQSLGDLPVAVLLCANDGTIHLANPVARRLLRLRRPPLDKQGNPQRLSLPAILDSLAGERAAAASDTHWAAVHAGVQYQRGSDVFRVRCVPLSGNANGWAVVLDDLTAEHHMQNERSQWLRFLSHDLRSPQVNILSQLTLDERAHPNAPGRAKLAAAVRREVERTLALADGFLDLGNAEAGDFAQGEVLIEAAVADAADQVWAYAQTCGIEVQVRAHLPGDVFVRGNRSLLTRVFVNLLNNAIRHSASGCAVQICVGIEGADVMLMVSDQGDGMPALKVSGLLSAGGFPPSMLPKSEPSTSLQPGATAAGSRPAPVRARGIGLAVVWTVVQRHGGWIDLWSAPGEGTSFVIGLPVSAMESISQPAQFVG